MQTIPFDAAALPAEQVSQAAVNELLKRGVVEPGDWVIMSKGDSYDTIGGTNTLKILHVGEPLA
ncbi:pyruvate kinase [compost metagenome]